jgi:hypothetical protein
LYLLKIRVGGPYVIKLNSSKITERFINDLFLPCCMETENPQYKKAHDKLLGVRNNLQWRKIGGQCHSAPLIVNDLTLNLAFAAEKGKLSEAQYTHILETPRADLLCEYLNEAREVWQGNKERFEVKTSGPGTWGGGNDRDMNLEKNVYRLTRAQLSDKHGVDDWHSSYRPHNEVYVDDVLYGRFLREHGLTDQKGAEITEDDLPSLESISKSNKPDVLKRYSAMQRARL